MKKRIWAILMALLLVLQLIPTISSAEEYIEIPGANTVYSVAFGEDIYLVTDGSSIDPLPDAPHIQGQLFIGWYDGDTLIEAPFTPTGDVVLQAMYQTADRTVAATIDDVTITLSGYIPKECDLTVTKTEADMGKRSVQILRNTPNEEPISLYSFDISITRPDGSEYQPEDGPVTVTLSSARFAEYLSQGRSIRVTHTLDDGAQETIYNTVCDGDTITFTVDHLSVFTFEAVWDLVEQIIDQVFGLADRVLSTAVGSLQVHIEGRLPRSATAAVTEEMPSINNETVLCATEITLLNGGHEVQPTSWGGVLYVTLESEEIAQAVADGINVAIWHISDDGSKTRLDEKEITVSPNGSVTFPADEFSIYAVTDGGENSRKGYRFWYNDGTQNILLGTEYFRYKDVHPSSGEPMQLYQPSIPGMEAATWNRIFNGWSKSAALTEPLFSINDLNTELNNLPSSAYDESCEDLYASLTNVYYITYVDINPNNILLVDLVPKEDTGVTTFTVQGPELRPAIDSDTELQGWQLIDDLNTIYTPGQTGVVIDQNITLYPAIAGGHWLIFDDNDLVDNGSGQMVSGGASFTPPAFYLDEMTQQPPDPVWDGYEFGGWYTDANCTTPFTFGQQLSVNTTIYAKWTPSDSSFRVIIWKQRSSDAAGIPDDEKTYDYVESYLREDVVTGQVVRLSSLTNPDYTRIYGNNGTSTDQDKVYFIYNATKTDQQVVVKADGTSVLNVYYDRKPVTLNFYIWDYTYTPTTSNSGTQYGLLEDGTYVQLTRNGNTWTYVSGTEEVYTQYNGTSEGDYYIPDGNGGYTSVHLYRNNNRWYRTRTGSWWSGYQYSNEYTGPIYTRTTQNITTTYTGTRYTRSNNKSWRLYKSFTGLYNSTLEENSYTWPSEYDWYSNGSNNGGTSGTRTTFMSAFLPTDVNTSGSTVTVNFYGSDPSGSYTIHFLTQNHDGTYTEKETVSASARNFYISDKYIGYHAVQYKADNGNWQSVGPKNANGYYNNGNTVSFSNHLYIRFDLNEYTLTFYTNNGSNQLIDKTVLYDAPLSEYQTQSEGQRNGHYFLGWYADPSCSEPFDFSQNMPDNNVAVYGKWKMERYRVVVDPGADNVAMGSQATSFRVDYDERIAGGLLESATRAGYILDGWYTSPTFEASSRFLFSNPITANTNGMDMTYQTSPAWASTRAAYGDDDEDHENVRGILHLYAKWILDPDSSGYNVVYDAGDAAIRDDLGNLLTTVPVDTSMYAFSDNATAITREAPSNYNDLYQFSYWEATLLNGTKIQLQPGDSIPLTEIAAVEIMYDESTGEVVRKTIKLTAIYTTTAGDRITHITYNGNTFTENWYDGTTHEVHGRTMDGTDRLEVTLNKEVNESIELPGAEYFYLEGYEMVGWSFQEGSEQTKHFDLGQVVAADNLDQDELNTEENTLYAMWFPRTYTAKIKQVIESGVPVNSFTYNFKTGEENGIGSIPAASVTLTGNSSFTASENLHYYNLSGDVISVDLTPHIPEDAAYDVRVNAVVTKDDGTREILQPTADGVYRIYGDVEITYTYSMKVLVRLQKRDALDHSIVLTDSVFVMTPVEFNSSTQHYEIAGSGKTVSINEAIVQRYLQEGIYKLTETTVPNGYASIGKDLYLEIYQDEAQSFRLFDEGGNTISANIAELDGTGRILTIYDRPVRTVTVTKQVTGGFGDQNKYFRFAITSAEDNESISGEGLTRQNDGSWGFSLKHGQSISITVLKGDTVTVTEVSDADSGRYTTTWNNGTTVSKVSTFDVNEDMYATVYNYLPPVAPTGTYVATQPYIILLLAGALLLILSLGVRRRAKVGDAYE